MSKRITSVGSIQAKRQKKQTKRKILVERASISKSVRIRLSKNGIILDEYDPIPELDNQKNCLGILAEHDLTGKASDLINTNNTIIKSKKI